MRWSIAVLTSIAVVALIYHNAVPRTQRWHIVLPGAALATGMWFRGHFAVRMLSKSLYRLRCHLRFLGVGIALLVWMYALARRAGWCRVQCDALAPCRCASTKAHGNATIACHGLMRRCPDLTQAN